MNDQKTKIVAIVAVAIAAVLGGILIGQGLGEDDEKTVTQAATQTPDDVASANQTTPTAVSDDDLDDGVNDDDLNDVNDANDVDDSGVTDADDVPVSNSDANRVADAAIRAVGGGMVNDLDRSDDPGEVWEVEVIHNGQEIDVALDSNLKRVPNQSYSD